jgi:CheY-like chemotaxis protein
LGLTISRQLIGMMSGRIWVESCPGKGSTFHFTALFGVASHEEAKDARSEQLEGKTVLIVDDNETNRTILEKILTGWGMRPTPADGATAAMQALDRAGRIREPFDLILLDSCMPGVDGFTFCEQIRHRPEMMQITIMVLSSAARHEDALRCRDLGVSSHLTKPLGHKELRKTIVSVLSGKTETLPSPAAQKLGSLNGRPLNILLAEDNEVNQELAVTLLKKRGHDIVVANNGREALAAWSKGGFDLILMDVQMPEMGGFEATAVIRAQEEGTGVHMPIIALTARAIKGDREKCLEAGMDAYVSKPLQITALMRAIDGLTPSSYTPPQIEERPPADTAVYVVNKAELIAQMDGNVGLFHRMAALFLADAPKKMEGIRVAVESGNAESLLKLSHALKGSAANFFAERAVAAAARLESMARKSDLEQAQSAFNELETVIGHLKTELAGLVESEDFAALVGGEVHQ